MIRRYTLQEREKIEAPSDPLEGKVVMGIDPGTNLMGYGVIRIEKGEARSLILGVITLGKYTNPYQKLRQIFERLQALIRQYQPDEVALEAPFYGENVQSMLKLGRAQGVAMAAALTLDKPVFEYAPRRVKQAITGQGAASKEQVAAMIEKIVRLEPGDYPADATDALGVALCHYYERSSPVPRSESGGKGHKRGTASWESYVNNHPNKIEP